MIIDFFSANKYKKVCFLWKKPIYFVKLHESYNYNLFKSWESLVGSQPLMFFVFLTFLSSFLFLPPPNKQSVFLFLLGLRRKQEIKEIHYGDGSLPYMGVDAQLRKHSNFICLDNWALYLTGVRFKSLFT